MLFIGRFRREGKEMWGKKHTNQLIYGFMSLLILLNALTPLSVFAEVESGSDFQFKKIVQGVEENSLDVTISLPSVQEIKINASQPIVESARLEKDGQLTNLTIENQQVIDLPKSTAGVGVIHLSLNQAVLKNTKTFELNYGQQVVTYDFKQSDPSTSESRETASSLMETTESKTTESESTTIDNGQNSTQTEATTDSSSKTKKITAPQAEGGNDIRSYFPNGDGTIISGSTITYIDENGNIVQPPVTADTNVRISYSWNIPEDVRKQIEAGDYFDFKLPDELKPKQEMSGELKNDAGEVYATYTVDKDGNVRFIFTDEVKNQSDIEGNFYFDTNFDKTHIDGPGDITIHYPTEDDLPPVDVEIRPNTEQSIDKKGNFDRTPNPSSVEWTVDFNQSMDHLTDATITEKWPAGIDYKSVKVMELVMNLDGTVKEVGRELSPDEYTVDENGNMTIKGDTNKAYRIIYQTDIDESVIPEDGGKVSFTNTAQLTDQKNTDGIDAKATVTNNYGKTIEKNNEGYNPDDQTFDWSIKYNYNEKNIPQKDATITDDLSDNLELVNGTVKVYPITFDEKGNEIKGMSLIEGQDYVLQPNPNGNGFVVKFLHDMDQAIKIEYQTKVNGLVTDPTQVTNQATVGTGQSDGDKGTADQQNVIKKATDVDYSEKTIGWKINVNKNHYYMENLVLKDTYTPNPGLTMAKKADGTLDFEIRDVTKNILLVPGVDYGLTVEKNADDVETGFKVIFKDGYNPTESELEINYHTNFDISLLDPEIPSLDHFNNAINATWEDQSGGSHHSDDNTNFKPIDPYQLNAKKDGTYNAQTKHITWTIAVNLSGNELKDAELRDAIKENQDYIKDSIKVYEATIQKNGAVVKKQPETVINDQMKKIAGPDVDNDQTLAIDFPDGSKETYLIEFETSVEGKIIEGSNKYTNTAEYENRGDKRDVIGEVSVKNGGSLAQKSGEQDPTNPDYVNWHAVINPSQSMMNNVVITDTPSDNQSIDQASIKLYETSVAENGTITPDFDKPLTLGKDYTVELTTDNVTGKQALTINMLNPIDRAYQLDYRSYITSTTSGNKDTLSNKINVKGDNDQTISGGDGSDVTVEVNHSGGSASGKKGSLSIQKTEADGKTKLSGAHFQLWNTTKTQLLREGDVDANGQLLFGALPYGEYLLIETKAPIGFTISDDLVGGRRVTINDKSSAENVQPLIIPNDRSRVILQKTDEAGNPIKLGGAIKKGARFKLEHLSILSTSNSLWQQVPIDPDTTDSNGQLTLTSLPLGVYRITEIEAPTGYVKNASPVSFIVYRNSNQQLPAVNLTYKNYKGSAQLSKQDSEGNPLAGAQFDVMDSDGKKVNVAPLTSDEEGKVLANDLAPGNYFFRETKAPAGYVLNTKRIPFTITDSENGKPAIVTTQTNGSEMILKNYQGAISFVKKDANGKTLVGAEFDVYDKTGKKINESSIVSDKDGKVTLDHLAPGNYTMKETKAPTGYLINDQTISFTISDTHEDAIPVKELDDFINYQGGFKLVKKNSDGDKLSGAVFTLYDKDKHSLNITATSKKDGEILFDHLAPGTYYYQETTAPTVEDGSNYVINPALIKVEIPNHYNGDPKVVELGDFQNFRGKAEVTKVGDGGSIAGAEFALSEIINGEEHIVRTITVPENGKLDLDGLGAGSYKLIETKAAPGYIINNQPIYFVVQDNDDQNPVIDNLDFANYQVEVIGKKVNEKKETLAGAEYQVFKSDRGQPIGDALSVFNREGKPTTTISTSSDGEIYMKGLEQGDYVLKESVAPKGYILDTEAHQFTIKEQTGTPESIKLGDFINYQGAVEAIKKDESGNALAKAEFEIRDENNSLVQTVVSDKDGKLSATDLQPGNYTMVETKAPKGYVLNTKKLIFKIQAENNGKPEKIELGDFINYQGSAQLEKVSEGDNALADAVFDLYKKDGTYMKEFTSDINGKILAEKLEPGEYYFQEKFAPKGFVLSDKKHPFTITQTNTDKPATIDLGKIVNKRVREKPINPTKPTTPNRNYGGSRSGTTHYSDMYPKTNDSKNPWLIFIGAMLTGIAGVFYYQRKKYDPSSGSDQGSK